MTDKPNDTGSGRDEKGRFVAGNPGGPGGSRRRAFTMRRAVEEAVSTEHLQAIVRRALRMALEGNLSATRLVLDRVCGRVADLQAEPEPIPVTLPPLRTAADCNLAVDRIIAGIVEGTLPGDEARLLLDAVQARLRSIEATDLEERLAELEKAAQSVDFRGARSRIR